MWGPREEMVADHGADAVDGAVVRIRGVGGRLPIAANMAFIAAANPTAILALLNEIADLRAALAAAALPPKSDQAASKPPAMPRCSKCHAQGAIGFCTDPACPGELPTLAGDVLPDYVIHGARTWPALAPYLSPRIHPYSGYEALCVVEPGPGGRVRIYPNREAAMQYLKECGYDT